MRAVLLLVLLVGCTSSGGQNDTKTTPPTEAVAEKSPTPSPTPEVGSEEQRLAVAAEIRHKLREQEIPANVVNIGTKLTIYYKVAQIEYAPDAFIKQQGKSGMERIARAGFDTLVIEAQGGRKETPLAEYR